MIDHCDYCNKPCCYGCPHAEEERTFEQNLEIGWDYAITEIGKLSTNQDIRWLVEIYWRGYQMTDYQQTGDPDSGLCYEIRSFAIHKILEVLENGK